MQIRRKAGLIAVMGLLTVTLTTGCEDEEFQDAPRTSARASSPGGDRVVGANAGAGGQARLGPVSGMELPPGHPPLGESGGGNPAAALAGAASGGVETPQIPRVLPEEFGKLGPILWEAPAHWQPRRPSNEMRFAEYFISGPAGSEPAELTVFYFGPGGGGGVEANLQRWASQLTGARPAEFGEREVNDVRVYTVDAIGEYDAGMAMGGGGPRGDQRLLGAIAETDEGLFFFRLLGDQSIVSTELEGFEAFVMSFRRGG